MLNIPTSLNWNKRSKREWLGFCLGLGWREWGNDNPPGLGAVAEGRIEMKWPQRGSENARKERRELQLPPHSWSSGAFVFPNLQGHVFCFRKSLRKFRSRAVPWNPYLKVNTIVLWVRVGRMRVESPTAQSQWHLSSTKALSCSINWELYLEEEGNCQWWGLWFQSQRMESRSQLGCWLHLCTGVNHFPP